MIRYAHLRAHRDALNHYLSFEGSTRRPDFHEIEHIVGSKWQGGHHLWDRVIGGVVFRDKAMAMQFKLMWHDCPTGH